MAKNPYQVDFDELTKSTQIAPDTQDFDESKGVEGRVARISSSGSPLMELAATRSRQQAQASGLRNSSLAVSAGQKSVLEAATPIAQADASLFQQQALTNQAAKNRALEFNASNAATIGLEGARLGQQQDQFAKSLFEQARQFDATGKQRESEFGRTLAEQGRQFDATGKQRESEFGRTLAEQGRQFDTTGRQRESEFGRTLAEQGRQFDTNFGMEREKLAAQREQFAQSLGLDSRKLDLAKDQLTQQQQQFLQELDQRDRQIQQQERLETQRLSMQKTLAEMDASSRKELAAIEAQFKTDIAGNQNIAQAWGTTMDSINRIQNNPDLEPGAKQAMIENQLGAFKSFTGFWKKVTGGAIDVSDLLNFGVTPGAGGSTGESTGSAPATSGGRTPADFGAMEGP